MVTTSKDNKNVSIKLPMNLWKKVKILSIHNETTMEVVIREMIEKNVNMKKVDNIINDENK